MAEGLGIAVPEAMPKAFEGVEADYKPSPALSLFSRPGAATIRTRHVAVLVVDGVEGEAVRKVYHVLASQGAVPRYVGVHLGEVRPSSGDSIQVEITLETAPPVLFDAVVIPCSEKGCDAFKAIDSALDFVKDHYRHGKPMLLLGEGEALLKAAGINSTRSKEEDLKNGLIIGPDGAVQSAIGLFTQAIIKHRFFERV